MSPTTHNYSLFTFHCSLAMLVIALIMACRSSVTVPDTYTDTGTPAAVYPDYDGVTIPPNIAPLTFLVNDSIADAFVATFDEALAYNSDASGLIQPDTTEWRNLLEKNKGKAIAITVYAKRNGEWLKHKPIKINIAEEPIDSFISYRLIEPGYELYRQLGLYQRDLTSYDEHVIYENNRTYDNEENHCVNCHNYQAYDTERMLFHVRAKHGGTMIIDHGDIRKIAIKHDSILAAGVYPSWHPTLPLVAFSTNKTGQIFHMQHRERIEVLDEASDLLLYDAEKNTVNHIFNTNKQFETFPCWSPKGNRLYYVSADVSFLPDSLAVNERDQWVIENYANFHYDIWSIPFDTITRTFGQPQKEVDCAAIGKSASVPRISPDGQFLLYTLADYGQFHVWHRTADLWIKPLTSYLAPRTSYLDNPPYPLTEANSPEADSYHSWSSNNRWIVFASRRDDGNFTRLYIAYIDKDGQAHKAFLIPQHDPRHNIRLLKSYNVPELTRHSIRVPAEEIRKAVLQQDAAVATYY